MFGQRGECVIDLLCTITYHYVILLLYHVLRHMVEFVH